jgi:undecaprenyl-diphosphatase
MNLYATSTMRILFVLCFGLFVVFGLLAVLSEFHEEITDVWLQGLDDSIQGYVHSYTTPPLTRLMFFLSLLGSWKVVLPVVIIAVIWLLSQGRQSDALVLALSVAGGATISMALKLWFVRARPSVAWALAHESTYSFPSGHSAAAVVFYGTIALLAFRRPKRGPITVLIGALAVFMILGIGLSRIYLGVHFPTDVLAGYFTGSIWLGAVAIADWQLRESRLLRCESREVVDEL